jgi:hypothetical protein
MGWRHSAVLGLLMTVNFLIQAVNMRAVAHMQYEWIAVTDASICLLNFTLIRRVAGASSTWDMACYTAGGTVGALAGVWLSRAWG